MGLFGTPKEQGTQVLFRDDGSFIIRNLEIVDGFLVEKDNEGVGRYAWMMFYKLLKRFEGFKNIGAGNVTLSYNRDVVFDPFNQLSETEKPEKGEGLKKEFIRKRADAKCYRHERSAKGSLLLEKITVFMGIIAVILALAIGAKAAFGG